jgi:hypothetical protein
MKEYKYTPPEIISIEDSFNEFMTNFTEIDKDLRLKTIEIYAALPTSQYNPACGYLATCYT